MKARIITPLLIDVIYETLQEATRPLSAVEIAETLPGWKLSSIRTMLWKLCIEGKVVKPRRGRYVIPTQK